MTLESEEIPILLLAASILGILGVVNPHIASINRSANEKGIYCTRAAYDESATNGQLNLLEKVKEIDSFNMILNLGTNISSVYSLATFVSGATSEVHKNFYFSPYPIPR